jgi:hypothetical protein
MYQIPIHEGFDFWDLEFVWCLGFGHWLLILGIILASLWK